MDSEEIIERYQRAYKAALGQTVYVVTYNRGWFTMKSGSFSGKFRRAEIEGMIDRLERRITVASPA
jgi:hypothetical protein